MDGKSLQFRERGNRIYRSLSEGLAPTLFAARTLEALESYRQAIAAAQNSQDRASAYKNLGACHSVQLLRPCSQEESNLRHVLRGFMP